MTGGLSAGVTGGSAAGTTAGTGSGLGSRCFLCSISKPPQTLIDDGYLDPTGLRRQKVLYIGKIRADVVLISNVTGELVRGEKSRAGVL